MRKIKIDKSKKVKPQRKVRRKTNSIDTSISIIISMWYKSLPYIKKCLDSIHNQSHFKLNRNYQIILGIDGYDQKTLQYIKSIKDNYRNLKVFYSKQNVGPYIMFNSLFQKSKHRNILRIDADDTLSQYCVQRLMKHIDNKDKVLKFKFRQNFYNVKQTKSPVKYSQFPLGAICFTRNVFNRVGGYFQYNVSCDRAFLLLCKRLGIPIKHINKYLYNRLVHKDALTVHTSTGKKSQHRKQIKKILKNRVRKCKIPIQRIKTELLEVK